MPAMSQSGTGSENVGRLVLEVRVILSRKLQAISYKHTSRGFY